MKEPIFHDINKDFWCETKFFETVSKNVLTQIDDYSLIITPSLTTLPETKNRKIVIVTGDELGNLGLNPYAGSNVLCIFRIFNEPDRFDNKFIFPIPPGYNWTMHSDPSQKMIRMYPEKRTRERHFDMFFSGQVMKSRKPMVKRLEKLKKKFTVYLNGTESFRTGINIDEYYQLLGNTKIALVPDGTSVDTFRYVEAMGSGCTIITTQKTPLWYYQDAPCVFIDDWKRFDQKLVCGILKESTTDKSVQCRAYYDSHLSETAVAQYMLRVIHECESRSMHLRQNGAFA